MAQMDRRGLVRIARSLEGRATRQASLEDGQIGNLVSYARQNRPVPLREGKDFAELNAYRMTTFPLTSSSRPKRIWRYRQVRRVSMNKLGMGLRPAVLHVVGLSLLLAFSTAAHASVSSCQAVRQVLALCKTLGWNSKGPIAVRSLKRGLEKGRLQIDIEGRVAAHVDRRTGKVVLAFNMDQTFRGTGTRISLDEHRANDLALGYLRKIGYPTSNLRVIWSRHCAERDWGVYYARVYNGVRFHEDNVYMTLDDTTGRLIGFGYNFRSPLPTGMRRRIDKALAASKAKAYISAAIGTPGEITSAELQIVTPNDIWERRESGTQRADRSNSRLAWVVRLNAPWDITEVWIDADDGTVLGGDRCLGSVKSKTHRFAFSEIASVSIQQVARGVRIQHLSSADMQTMLRELQNLRPSGKPQGKPIRRVILRGKQRSYVFQYQANGVLTLVEKRYQGHVYRCKLPLEASEALRGMLTQRQ